MDLLFILASLIITFITILDTAFNTGNSIADSIIKSNNISFELNGRFQEKCLIKPVHMCTIFANAIDNAIDNHENQIKNYRSEINE